MTVRSGGETRMLVPLVDGRAQRAVRVSPGVRRVSVPLPVGHWRVRVRAVGRRGARASPARTLWVLPRRSARPGTDRGRVDRVLQRRLEAMSASAGFTNGVYARHLVTGCGAAVNAGAQFPAASTLKAAILLDAVRRPRGASQGLLDRMVIDSDDVAANSVLAAHGGGDALAGAASVSETMQRVGMSRSLVRRPYIIDQELIPVRADRPAELYTNYVSTHYDLATLMVALHRGALGRGPVRRMGLGPATVRRDITRAFLRCATAPRSSLGSPRVRPWPTRRATPARSKPMRGWSTRPGDPSS